MYTNFSLIKFFAFSPKIRYTLLMKQSALVLSGGGALGIAHLWAVFALKSEGYEFDWYAGVSAGAIITASLAVGYTPLEIKNIYFQTHLLGLAFDLGWHKWGIIAGKKIKEMLKKLFWNKKIEELSTPLFIGVTNYETWERIMIDRGLISDAVLASVSVPGFIAPYFHPEYSVYCVDGGMTHNFPLDTASKEYTGTTILWIDVMTDLSNIITPDKNLIDLSFAYNLQRTFQIFLKNQPLPNDKRITIFRPKLGHFSSFDVFHFDEIWQAGYESVCPNS